VSPGDCIGHGACKTICPVDAIKLVFGSERRGVDIPILTPSFESTVPGISSPVSSAGWGSSATRSNRDAGGRGDRREAPGG